MNDVIRTLGERFPDWQRALLEHIQLSLLTIVLAIVIALPLAVFLARFRRLSEAVLQIAGICQTIPSLAILGLLIPFMGIGTAPALTALVIYALFPILQNTITGLNGIDPILIEAGTAFGMTKWERLKKFELPLAMPVIMSGIRTSAVMVIGTATLAALIGAGGLGSFILLGIDRNNSSLILIGAVSSALLAVLVNLVLKWLEKARLRTIFISGLLVILLLLTSYISLLAPGRTDQKKIRVAGKLGVEPEILINLYKQLIEDETDLSVELEPNFGKTSFLYEAVKSGDIDIYPEFTGTVTSSLLKRAPAVSGDPREVYEAAREGIYRQDGLVLLEPMAYQNTYAVAVPRRTAEDYHLERISDLKAVEKELAAGFTLEFHDREDGYQGLQKVYGLDLKVSTMEPALRYRAIESGDIQITDAYSTDAELTEYDMVVLEDDQKLFPPYQGAPMMRESLLEEYPELEPVLNRLAGKITEAEMSQMNYRVSAEGEKAEDVAREYLEGEGLLD